MEKAKHAAHIGEKQTLSFTGGVFRSVLLSLLSGVILLSVFSYLLYQATDHKALLTPLAFLCGGLAALSGGFYGGRVLRHSGALCGLTVGICLVFFFMLSALILRAGELSTAAIPLDLLILTAATIGGAAGGKKRRKRRR